MKPLISVVIPVYNGGDTFMEVLRQFEQQTLPFDQFELIVVDDCGSDNTWERVQKFAKNTPLLLRLFQQPENQGVSSTRNLGASHATAPVLLFVDQDCLPAPDLVAQHLEIHNRYAEQPVVVAGRIIWSPEFAGSEAIEFYKSLYFPVWEGIDRANAPFYYFVTSNASVRRDKLTTNLFDPEFRHMYDDQIAGWKLQQAGYRIILDEQAVVYHHRDLSLAEVVRRYRKQGSEAARVAHKYPQLVGILFEPGHLLTDSHLKQALYRLVADWAMAEGLTEGLGREFPDQSLIELLDQTALLKNFETWRERRLEQHLSEIASLRQDNRQQLGYIRKIEREYQHQLTELNLLQSEYQALAAHAVALEKAQIYSLLSRVLGRRLAHLSYRGRKAWLELRHRLAPK